MALRWSQADVDRLTLRQRGIPESPPAKPAKYRNQPVVIDGLRFASKLEGRCYEELKLRQANGEVLWVVRQIGFELEGGVVYRADFLAVLAAGGVEVLDATGKLTQVKINKLKQVKARYGVDVKLWPMGELVTA